MQSIQHNCVVRTGNDIDSKLLKCYLQSSCILLQADRAVSDNCSCLVSEAVVHSKLLTQWCRNALEVRHSKCTDAINVCHA